jgi:GNAT superfamily N-acetyltransferase
VSTSNVSDRSVKLRFAEPADAERIATVINSAFRRAEEFFVDGDRIDVASVLNFLDTGKFLLAESESVLLGCVYVEPRSSLVNEGSLATHDRTPHDPAKQDSELVGGTSNSQFEIRNPKFPRAYLGLLSVDPAHQHSGLGSVLMDAAEDYCRGQGSRFMDIKVVNLREELFGFYQRRGYVETGTSPFPTDVEIRLPCYFIDMSKPLREEKQ